ncbi:MAG: relaxase/mobilization nuclease domain-containing protein [Cyclobacteriaceae bacterium]
MISKASCISHLSASIEYVTIEEKGSMELDRQNLVGDAAHFPKEMTALHHLNSRCVNNTIRIEISPDPRDIPNLTESNWRAIPKQFIKLLGEKVKDDLNEHQWVAYKHEMAGPENDIPRPHIHIYINRIGFDGKAVKDKFIGKKVQVVAHELAKKKGMISARDLMDQKIKEGPVYLKETLIEAAKHSNSIQDFQERASREGVEVTTHKNLDGQVKGLKVHFEDKTYKISDIHRSLTLNRIDKLFNSYGKKRGISL